MEEGSAAERMAIGFGAGSSRLSVAVEGYQMTAQGPRKLGSGKLESGGSKGPGGAVPLGVAIATGNPLGLIVTSGIKVYGEASGSSKIDGRAEQTAKEIGVQLKPRFQQQGWSSEECPSGIGASPCADDLLCRLRLRRRRRHGRARLH